jgi:hypothetical protein
MSDKITGSSKCLNPDNSPCHWEFSYDVEHETLTNQFCVVVKAEEMDEATSESEAKTKANVKAIAIKTAWIASLANAKTTTPDITEAEDVTL